MQVKVKTYFFTINFCCLKGLFIDPCDRYARFYGVTDRSNYAVTVTEAHFGPIRYTTESPESATGIEEMKSTIANHIPELKTVHWYLHVNSVNNPFNQEMKSETENRLCYNVTSNKNDYLTYSHK